MAPREINLKKSCLLYRRSLLSRDQKGHLVAGLYFPVGANTKDAHFTLFFDNGVEKCKKKYKFTDFADVKKVNLWILDKHFLAGMISYHFVLFCSQNATKDHFVLGRYE